jgi:hypothetical protein
MKASIRWFVSAVAASIFASCSGDTHELGQVPGAGGQLGAGGTSSPTGSGGSSGLPSVGGVTGVGGAAGGSVSTGHGGAAGGSVVDAPVAGGSGGTTGQGGAPGKGGTSGQGSGDAGADVEIVCCNALYCPAEYTLIGPVGSGSCPTGYQCSEFTACGCNLVLCARPLGSDAGVGAGGSHAGGASGTGGIGGGGASGTGGIGGGGASGRGGATAAGGTGGSSCPLLPSCNWCGGEYLLDATGCVTGFRCANGVDPCKTAACSASAPCAAGETCSNMLCWPGDAGAGGATGTGGTSGSGGSSGGTGGAGGSTGTSDLCGGSVCGEGLACCGPPECGRCVNALSGQYCPSTCTAAACGPSGASCQAGEVCLDVIYYTTTTRTGTATCKPNPCGSQTLSCTCATTLCQGTPTSCSLADDASKAVVCSTK